MAINTLYFKDVCKDYDTFVSSEVAQETISNFPKMYVTTDEGFRVEVDLVTTLTDCYRLLYRRYKNWEIAYINPSDFYDILWELIEMHLPNYVERYNHYTRLLQLTDSDLLSNDITINNFVEHTDSEVEDPLNTVIPSVTNQDSSKSFAGKAQRLRQIINTTQYNLKNDFLNKFKFLFLRFGSSAEITSFPRC